MARRGQETADDHARKDEPSRKMYPVWRRSRGGGDSRPASTLRVDPRRRQSASSALRGHQRRDRKNQCGRASYGWMPSAPGVVCDACPGNVVHSTTVALCAAYHRCLWAKSKGAFFKGLHKAALKITVKITTSYEMSRGMAKKHFYPTTTNR